MLKLAIRALLIAILLHPVLWAAGISDAEPVRIAAAANLRSVLPRLIAAYSSSDHTARIEAVYGSSGRLYAQIMAKAPFDLYLSANVSYPEMLHKAGMGESPPLEYARGRAVCASLDEGFPAGGAMAELAQWLSESEGMVAIANPELAPYGRAYLGYYTAFADSIPRELDPTAPSSESRILLGSNVGQAKQFLTAGAQAAFLPLSELLDDGRGFRWIEIDSEYAGEIRQAGILLTQQKGQRKARAAAFWRFILSDRGQSILQAAGYR